MSCNYAEGLSPYPNKGRVGMPERIASKEEVTECVQKLVEMMKESKHTVVHSGAGISTSAGIPDFRGPKGVWTLEKKGLKPDVNVSFDDAKPTYTHMALVALEKAGYIQYLVTQNIDGLHLRSGFPRPKMAELHGNMYLNKCSFCKREFVRHTAVSTVGQKTLGVSCPGKRETGRSCRGRLFDNILDWEHGLPHLDYHLAEKHSIAADLNICLGTTLQIVPSGVLPTVSKPSGGKLVICNLQPTKHDRISDLIVNFYVDDVMRELLSVLSVECEDYCEDKDPVMMTKALKSQLGEVPHTELIEWTINDDWFEDEDLVQKVETNQEIAAKKKAATRVVKRVREKGDTWKKLPESDGDSPKRKYSKRSTRRTSIKRENVCQNKEMMENMDREQRRRRRSQIQDKLYENEHKKTKLQDQIKSEDGEEKEGIEDGEEKEGIEVKEEESDSLSHTNGNDVKIATVNGTLGKEKLKPTDIKSDSPKSNIGISNSSEKLETNNEDKSDIGTELKVSSNSKDESITNAEDCLTSQSKNSNNSDRSSKNNSPSDDKVIEEDKTTCEKKENISEVSTDEGVTDSKSKVDESSVKVKSVASDCPVADKPSPVADKPSPVADKPSPVADKPSPVADKPSPVADKPSPVADKPSPVADKPSPVADKPSPVADKPSPVADKPSPVADKPSPVADKPSPVADKPSLVADKPSLVADKPSPVADKPSLVADKPSLVADKPSLVADKPSLVADKPSLVADKPSLVADKPSPVADKPSPVADKPSLVADKPSLVADKPSLVADKPSLVADKPSPVADKPSPVADKPSPVADKPSPVADKPSPVADEPSPVADKPSPVADKPSPVADKPSPVAETPSPVAETPSSVGDKSSVADSPVTDKAPVADKPTPIGEVTESSSLTSKFSKTSSLNSSQIPEAPISTHNDFTCVSSTIDSAESSTLGSSISDKKVELISKTNLEDIELHKATEASS